MIGGTILPPNATALKRALDLLAATRLGDIDTPLRQLWSPADCPEDLLPWLAWSLSIDQWDANWPLAVRRARVANAIAVQRRKGTRGSVNDVVRAFGGNIAIREWFEETPPAPPHTFTLSIALSDGAGGVPSAEFVDAVIGEVTRAKPARSHFTFALATSARGRIGLRGVGRAAIYARLPCQAAAA